MFDSKEGQDALGYGFLIVFWGFMLSFIGIVVAALEAVFGVGFGVVGNTNG